MVNSISAGILLGAAICFLNIRWLGFFANNILRDMKNVRTAKVLTYATFIFRYLIITAILYVAAKSQAVNLMAFLGGFTAFLFSTVAMWLIQGKGGENINGRTTSLY